MKTLSEMRVSGGGYSLEGRGLSSERVVHTTYLRNFLFLSHTGCLILFFFLRTGGLVTAPGEIELTEPICTHKINKTGLWV